MGNSGKTIVGKRPNASQFSAWLLQFPLDMVCVLEEWMQVLLCYLHC